VLQFDFRLDFSGDRPPTKPPPVAQFSTELAGVIHDDILREVSLGCILGPFPDLRILPIGTVPKVDGESRFDGSMNAGIAYSETHFNSIDEAIRFMRLLVKAAGL